MCTNSALINAQGDRKQLSNMKRDDILEKYYQMKICQNNKCNFCTLKNVMCKIAFMRKNID